MNSNNTTTTSDLRAGLNEQAVTDAQATYRRLIDLAADSGGSIFALDEPDRRELLAAADTLGVPGEYDLDNDVRSVGRLRECEAAISDAEAELASFPPEREIRQAIDDCDVTIRETLENVLLPAKREQLQLLADRTAAADRLRSARGRLGVYAKRSKYLGA